MQPIYFHNHFVLQHAVRSAEQIQLDYKASVYLSSVRRRRYDTRCAKLADRHTFQADHPTSGVSKKPTWPLNAKLLFTRFLCRAAIYDGYKLHANKRRNETKANNRSSIHTRSGITHWTESVLLLLPTLMPSLTLNPEFVLLPTLMPSLTFNPEFILLPTLMPSLTFNPEFVLLPTLMPSLTLNPDFVLLPTLMPSLTLNPEFVLLPTLMPSLTLNPVCSTPNSNA